MLSALLAENARLAESLSPAQTPAIERALMPTPGARPAPRRTPVITLGSPGILERVFALLAGPNTARSLVGFMGVFLLLAISGTTYVYTGGRAATGAASVDGGVKVTELRRGPAGLAWTIGEPASNAIKRQLRAGDTIVAQSQITLTFPNNTQAVLVKGSEIVVLADNGFILKSGQLIGASQQAQTTPPSAEARTAATPLTIVASESAGSPISTTFVMTDAIISMSMKNGAASVSVEQGSLSARSGSVEKTINSGEQSHVDEKSGLSVQVSAPLVFTQTTASGAISFTAKTIVSGSLVVIDTSTGAELATFKADSNGVVIGELAASSTMPSNIGIKATDNLSRSSASTTMTGSAPRSAAGDVAAGPAPLLTSQFLPTATRIAPSPTLRDQPKIRLPVIAPVQASSSRGAIVSFQVDIIDADGVVFPATCDQKSPRLFQLGTTHVTCSGSRDGFTVTGEFKVSVVDQDKPALRIPANMRVAASNANGAAVSFAASAEDAIDGLVKPDCAPASSSVFGFGSSTVTCTATDGSGNEASASFVITVSDNDKPVLKLPGDKNVSASSDAGAIVDFSVAASDRIDAAPEVNCSPRPGSFFAMGKTKVTCSAKDQSGNADSGSFTVSVLDDSAPRVTVSGPVSREADGSAGASVSFSASAEDSIDGKLAASCSPASGSVFPLGATAVRCTATDKGGNTGAGNFVVTIMDSRGPVISVQAPSRVDAASARGSVITYGSNASDAVDGAVAVSCSPRSGALFPLGATTVSCDAADAHGNHGHTAFSVVVQDGTDPVINASAPGETEATGPGGAAVSYSVSAEDAIDGALSASCSPRSGSNFPLGGTQVTCSASDKSGNSASSTFRVAVVDHSAPSVNAPSDMAFEASGPGGATVSFAASASDLVDGSLSASCNAQSGGIFPLGATTVSCSARDKAGNSASRGFKITVRDTTAPHLNVPGNVSREAGSATGMPIFFSASANDAVDSNVELSCSPASGSTFAVGNTTVTCSARDNAGNINTDSFRVHIGFTPTATPTPEPTGTATPDPTATPLPPTVTPDPTATPLPPPTVTPDPTNTPLPPPTVTPDPTNTPLPPPTEIPPTDVPATATSAAPAVVAATPALTAP